MICGILDVMDGVLFGDTTEEEESWRTGDPYAAMNDDLPREFVDVLRLNGEFVDILGLHSRR